ncbi:hypothetical protein P7L53_15955 [Thermoleptolyngbya sichuanensis XZ-Cy5]|nr:hypothetical protein [Thermoleptolyngbya sichuanensis XZ-Cy5]
MEKPIDLSPETMNAVITALGALVFATVRRLEPAQQQAFAEDLARMAKVCNNRGDLMGETLLMDLWRAAQGAGS